MKQDILYQDSLISIRNDSITLKNYYFPFFIPKRILYTDIEKIEMDDLNLGNGRWRLWGTMIFTCWFPLDLFRPVRKKVFIITYKNKRMRSCFTVKNYIDVEKIFKEKGFLV